MVTAMHHQDADAFAALIEEAVADDPSAALYAMATMVMTTMSQLAEVVGKDLDGYLEMLGTGLAAYEQDHGPDAHSDEPD